MNLKNKRGCFLILLSIQHQIIKGSVICDCQLLVGRGFGGALGHNFLLMQPLFYLESVSCMCLVRLLLINTISTIRVTIQTKRFALFFYTQRYNQSIGGTWMSAAGHRRGFITYQESLNRVPMCASLLFPDPTVYPASNNQRQRYL